MRTLGKCSVCGHITDDFVQYGSIAEVDEYPAECPVACSSACMADAVDKILAGEWVPPKLRRVAGAGHHNISRPRSGYEKQPSQEALLVELLAKEGGPREGNLPYPTPAVFVSETHAFDLDANPRVP